MVASKYSMWLHLPACILSAAVLQVEGFSIQPPAKLFVNVVAKDPSDDISNQLSAKLGIKGRIKSLNGKTSASPDATAKKPMAPNPQATKLATAMTQKVPYVLATKGVGSEMEQDFQEGPFVVMKLNVRHVDDATMKKDTPRKSLGFQVQRILKLIGRKEQDKLDEYLIQKFVEKQLKTILMELKEETGVEAESVVRRDEKQEKYYNTKLSELRSLAEKIGRV